ncbi:MAG: glycosyltransferase [Candidatus Aenigmarchaeota archaeon]|nr:glycosyltransferase [Candidatus Aenigmarchaeota archaeon]MDW8149558.1 glycosyltransferase [Candidatus Aenigmarchaeota archaeon]
MSELARIIPSSYSKWVDNFRKKNLIDKEGLKENVKIHIISTFYLIPDGKNKKLGEKLFKLFDRYIQKNKIEFDLIHAHFIWPQGYVAAKLGKKYNRQVIITAHGHDVYDLPFRNYEWLNIVHQTLKSVSKIITVSNSNLRIIKNKLGIDPMKVEVIPNGFSKNYIQIENKIFLRRKLNLPTEGKKILLNVAALVPIKGHKYLIEAMNIISKKRDDVICIIIGDGPMRSCLQKKIKENSLEEKVILLGFKPHDEIPLWMDSADLFVLPSLNEGNPTVMFEALGVGLPFVGTAVGGVPEIITSKDYGLLCKPADSEDLAEKILIALEKEWDREKIRKYAERFTWENIAMQVVRVYEGVLKGR